MTRSNWWRALALGCALLGGVAGGCKGDDPSTLVRATSRVIRGRVPVRAGANRVTRVLAINARTRRVVAQAEPAADGTFTLTGVTVGAVYKVNAVAGRRVIPVTFPKARGAAEKTNLFMLGDMDDPRVGALDGPVDMGDLMENAAGTFDTPPERAPNLQEDYDRDGVPDGADPDIDGDGMPNAADPDDDGDGMADVTEFGDQDGDGLTPEADLDDDGDGMSDMVDADNDNDGVPDATDPTPSGATGNPPDDRDGDGLPDAQDETPAGQDVPPDAKADAGAPDDVGEADAGAGDAGSEDGGAGEDAAGEGDAGTVEADGGFDERDAGAFDAGSAVDF